MFLTAHAAPGRRPKLIGAPPPTQLRRRTALLPGCVTRMLTASAITNARDYQSSTVSTVFESMKGFGFPNKIYSCRKTGGHPFMTFTRRGEGVRLRWTHVDGGRGVQPHVDVHTKN